MPHEQSPDVPYFEDEESTPLGSLSDYISKRLQNRAVPDLEASDKTSPETFLNSPAANYPPSSQVPDKGMVLHHLDSQLANSHLERFLPTPSTRYQTIRSRVSEELEGIYHELNRYRQFHGSEYKAKIEALEARATLLQRKIFELDLKIAKLNPFQSVYTSLNRFSVGFQKHPAQTGFWAIIPNQHRSLKDEVSAVSQDLESIQHILEEQLHDPSLTPQQLSRLVNEYDIQLRKAERLMEQLRSQKSLTARLNDKLTGWYKSFYSNDTSQTVE